jgi:hypothetical protein
MTFLQHYFWLGASLIVLAAIAVNFLRKRLKLRHARSWPAEGGRVESTVVQLVSRGQQQSIYLAEVRYSYAVADTAHTGRLQRSFLRKASADKWIANFTSGLPLTVRYNPGKADDSVIFEAEQTVPARRASDAAK